MNTKMNLFRHLKISKYPTCMVQTNILVFLGCFFLVLEVFLVCPCTKPPLHGGFRKALHQLRSRSSSKRSGLKCEGWNCMQIDTPGIVISQLGGTSQHAIPGMKHQVEPRNKQRNKMLITNIGSTCEGKSWLLTHSTKKSQGIQTINISDERINPSLRFWWFRSKRSRPPNSKNRALAKETPWRKRAACHVRNAK